MKQENNPAKLRHEAGKTRKQENKFALLLSCFLVFMISPLAVFADEGHALGEEHNNDVAAIDPLYAGLAIIVAVIIGIFVWRVLLKKKQ